MSPEPEVTVSWLDPVSGVFARVMRFGERSFVLWWTDGGPNDWTEEYESEAVVILRLACLVRCAEVARANGDGLFTHDTDTFAQRAESFLDREVH